MGEYAEVWVNVITDAVDRPFHYRVPGTLSGEVQPGDLVNVPFGKQKVRGCVENILEAPAVSENKTRDIISREGNSVSLSPEMLSLARWISRNYYCRFMEAVNLMLPPGHGKVSEKREKFIMLTPHAREYSLYNREELRRKAPRQAMVLDYLGSKGASPWKEVSRATGAASAVLNSLARKELVEVEERTSEEFSWLEEFRSESGEESPEPLVLTPEQEEAYNRVVRAMSEEREEGFLLHGVTGSGKTEVYLRAIEYCLQKGREALLLVPEIALTPQMVNYITRKLSGKVVLLHSSLSLRERYQQWLKVKEGKASVVLGTRSAVFAPLNNIGLIIIDEEQENSYKQEEAPRYHAVTVAEWRASYHRAVKVWGSATPSVETYYRAQLGEINLVEMSRRATPYSLPPVEVVDMRQELQSGHKSIFSRQLTAHLEETLQQGEQALLFINRRGFSSFVLCRECGHVVRCPYCSVSLTYHAHSGKMVCHYCAYTAVPLSRCPGCSGVYIKYFGTGTQKVETEVKRLFPEHSVMRMDRDTTLRKGAHRKIWQSFRSGKAQIMVGTQMVAKGMDFPGVTLVGVIAADTALHLPDFRASEKTFQLLTQVSGRAGRGEKKGTVVVQTYHPDHYSIECARDHNYIAFYREEISVREELQYPPFTEMLRLVFVSTDEKEGWRAASEVAETLEGCLEGVELLGPATAPLYRIKGYYRNHLILKDKSLQEINEVVRDVVWKFRQSSLGQKVRLTVDFNPMVML